MPFGLPSKKSSALATKPEAMASEVTLVGQSNTMSEKQASAGPSKKETKMTWKEAQEACRKEHSWEILVSWLLVHAFVYLVQDFNVFYRRITTVCDESSVAQCMTGSLKADSFLFLQMFNYDSRLLCL
ncbi:uncharacterized protein TRIVIDRAFT_34814 [Trichoderma virens Gv29-8]|uniref:Uncharacterized protein n=1 Tax=Hypocrea virens (strain Gv29-8 / FGSC 10586) TaxID=413071 RepID=G9MEZ6_HYPVG|nr:uncharacterized protein TRIVIDRAFT_34814 [Trichoderma virens Gv29-8]EHK26964.1 hypothetical protein TRIVIDRAFT_34814 [Trichoderma virens Gv29-8]